LNSKVNYGIHKSSLLSPILRQTKPVHITPSYLSKIHHNIIDPPTSWSSLVSFSLAFLLTTCTCWYSLHSFHMQRPSHPPRVYYSKYTWRGVQIMKLLVMQFSLSSRHFVLLRSKHPLQHPVLKRPVYVPPLMSGTKFQHMQNYSLGRIYKNISPVLHIKFLLYEIDIVLSQFSPVNNLTNN
jgi:hypothetical protein